MFSNMYTLLAIQPLLIKTTFDLIRMFCYPLHIKICSRVMDNASYF